VEAARVEAERALGLVVAGKFKEARASAETAQRVLLEQRGPDDAETMQSRYVLGVIQEQLRDDEAAVASLRTATAGFETLYGADDARLVGTLQSLGEVLRRRGEIDAARGALDRAIAIGRLRYGQRHPLVAMALTKLAAIEITAARSEVAVRVLDEAEQAVVEGDLSARAQVLATRGRVRLELEEDGARAEPDLREALRLRRASADGRNPIEWFTQAELGVAVALQGRHAEAEQLLLEAQRELLAQLGPGAYQNALLAHRLSRAYALAGRWPASADAMRDTIQITEKNYGDDHVLSFHYRLILVDRLSHVAAARAEAVALADALEARWAGRPEVEDGLAELALHRARLRLAGGDAAGARAIARAAVAAGDRPADDDVRRQLQAIAGG
jgi:serine/threonine-protein kinase